MDVLTSPDAPDRERQETALARLYGPRAEAVNRCLRAGLARSAGGAVQGVSPTARRPAASPERGRSPAAHDRPDARGPAPAASAGRVRQGDAQRVPGLPVQQLEGLGGPLERDPVR